MTEIQVGQIWRRRSRNERVQVTAVRPWDAHPQYSDVTYANVNTGTVVGPRWSETFVSQYRPVEDSDE